jgi:hypothetical protein
MIFQQKELCDPLKQRRLLCRNIAEIHQLTLSSVNQKQTRITDWNVTLEDNLLFDAAGLNALANTIHFYRGKANQLHFKLQLSKEAIRDYYSHSTFLESDDISSNLISLPITANRKELVNNDSEETLIVTTPELRTNINYPVSLTQPDVNSTPLGLLMPYSCEHDCLFANQIALFSLLNERIRRSPLNWLRAIFSRRKVSLNQRISLSWKQVHRSADIHSSAIIEGSVIGEGCRIGAHCVVRYSVLGKNVQLYDGAKVEYSAIDDNSWLMHDLVLYRCLIESDVFLIHGPYQFSYFQKQSAAFASIMMDYRPDAKPIRINTPSGVRQYQGRFLGALVKEKSKVFGGTLTSPGITIPAGKEIIANPENITKAKDLLS